MHQRGLPEREAHRIDRVIRDVEIGRFERRLSALTAAGALITAAEILFEHAASSGLPPDPPPRSRDAGGQGPGGGPAAQQCRGVKGLRLLTIVAKAMVAQTLLGLEPWTPGWSPLSPSVGR